MHTTPDSMLNSRRLPDRSLLPLPFLLFRPQIAVLVSLMIVGGYLPAAEAIEPTVPSSPLPDRPLEQERWHWPELDLQAPEAIELEAVPGTPINPHHETLPTDFQVRIAGFRLVGWRGCGPSQAELLEGLQPLIGQKVTFQQLLMARDHVIAAYHREGFTTTTAYLPPQPIADPESATITIAIQEGQLEAIQILGLKRLQNRYISDRLQLASQRSGCPFNQNKLLDALQRLQLDPKISSISAILENGSRPHLSILNVTVQESDTLRGELAIDNYRSPSIGTVRHQATIEESNLLGIGDALRLGYIHTEGSNTWDFSYELPVNSADGTLKFSARTSTSEVIEEPFQVLDIETKSRNYQLVFRQPVIRKGNQELALGISFSHQESNSSLLGFAFPLSPGADNRGQTKVSVFSFFQEWLARSPRSVLWARSQFNLGNGLLDATLNREDPDSQFFSWQAQAQWIRKLSHGLLSMRGELQLADRELLSSEKFAAGGGQSVRGYRQDSLVSDSGIAASAELRWHLLGQTQRNHALSAILFCDWAMGWNATDRVPDPNALASVGLGLRWDMGDRLSAALEYGIPLIPLERSAGNTWQENGLTFSVRWLPLKTNLGF